MAQDGSVGNFLSDEGPQGGESYPRQNFTGQMSAPAGMPSLDFLPTSGADLSLTTIDVPKAIDTWVSVTCSSMVRSLFNPMWSVHDCGQCLQSLKAV